MKDLLKLRKELAELGNQMRAITAEAEKRDDHKMTEDEVKKWDGIRAKAENLKQEIQRAEYENSLEMNAVEDPAQPAGQNPAQPQERKFESLGEYLVAVRNAQDPSVAKFDPRLVKAPESRATGANINIPSEGGFLADTTMLGELFKKMNDMSMSVPAAA